MAGALHRPYLPAIEAGLQPAEVGPELETDTAYQGRHSTSCVSNNYPSHPLIRPERYRSPEMESTSKYPRLVPRCPL